MMVKWVLNYTQCGVNCGVHFPQLESSRKLSEIKSVHDKIRVSTDEAKKKEEIYKQLVTDWIYISSFWKLAVLNL